MEDKKYKINYLLSTFLHFLLPFVIGNLVFAFFPQMLNGAPKLKVFYEKDFTISIFVLILILITTLETLIDALVIKRRDSIKILGKNNENKECKKIFGTYIVLELLFFVPLISISSTIYYNNKKEVILNFLKKYDTENVRNLQHLKSNILVIGCLIPFSFNLTISILFPQIFGGNEPTSTAFKDTNNIIEILSISMSIILIISYVYFEISIFKRNQTLKKASQSNEKMSKVYLIGKGLHVFMIVPGLSMAPEIYYLINKKRIENQ